MAGIARFVGIELSGSALAGLHTWVAVGAITSGSAVVERVVPLVDLVGVVERDLALPALAKWIAKFRRAIVVVNAPFGLPTPLVPEATWHDFVLGFRDRYPSFDEFFASCAQANAGRMTLRKTDRGHGLRSAPFKRRLAFQTYYNLRDVVGELVRSKRAHARPMQPTGPGPTLVETHVAAAIRARRWSPPFRGAGNVAVESRVKVLERLAATEHVKFSTEAAEENAITGGDGFGLNAVVAASMAAKLALEPDTLNAQLSPAETREGFIYA